MNTRQICLQNYLIKSGMEQTNTVRELLFTAQQQLADSDSARLDAEILLSTVMKSSREIFYAHPDNKVEEELVSDFRSLIAMRAAGCPVAYLTGRREFWSIEFTVNRHTLIPRPETECLVEAALDMIPEGTDISLLDLGTGSGAIAVAVATERPLCNIVAVDVDEEAVCVARTNAVRHQASNIRFMQSDWFSNLKNESFDIILCNPPYVDSSYSGFAGGELRFEPRIALDGGYLGMEIINHIIPASTLHLKTGGYLFLEHGYDQADSIKRLFGINRFTDFTTRADHAGIDRVSYARLA